MMRLSRKWVARAICIYALHITPPHRKDLAQAMLVELDHVSDGDALGFAAGCAHCAVSWWLTTEEGVTQGARFAISAGTAALAFCVLTVAFRVWAGGVQDVAWALVSIAAFYAVAALLAWKVGLDAVARYSGAGLVLNTLALLSQITAPSGAERYGHYMRALVIEGYGVLGLLLGFTLSAHWMARRLEARS